jgi:hypothetical protein
MEVLAFREQMLGLGAGGFYIAKRTPVYLTAKGPIREIELSVVVPHTGGALILSMCDQ